MESEPPLKRARSGVAASRAALQSALDTTDAQKTAEASRVVLECNAELAAALRELNTFQAELAEAEQLRERVRAQEEAVRRRVGELSAAERRLLTLELEAAGELSYLHPERPLVPASTLLRPLALRRLVVFAQQIAYSTAGPPLAPAGSVSLMPLAGTMRLSTLYAPVPRLADPQLDAALRPPPARAAPLHTAAAAAPPPPPPRTLPPELDLDLDLGSSDEDSSESSAASEQEEDNSW